MTERFQATPLQDWLQRSTAVSALSADVYFLLDRHFYVGDPNDSNQVLDDAYRVDIPLVDLPGIETRRVASRDVSGRIDQLIAHYRSVISLAKQHGRSWDDIRTHFWLRLTISADLESLNVSFPWHDTLSEFLPVFDLVVDGAEGDDWLDLEQGWRCDMLIRNGRVYVRACDIDDEDDDWFNASVDRDQFAQTLRDVRSNIVEIVDQLTCEFGRDVWSSDDYASRHEEVFGLPSGAAPPPERPLTAEYVLETRDRMARTVARFPGANASIASRILDFLKGKR